METRLITRMNTRTGTAGRAGFMTNLPTWEQTQVTDSICFFDIIDIIYANGTVIRRGFTGRFMFLIGNLASTSSVLTGQCEPPEFGSTDKNSRSQREWPEHCPPRKLLWDCLDPGL